MTSLFVPASTTASAPLAELVSETLGEQSRLNNMPHIVIVGGGVAGFALAKALCKTLCQFKAESKKQPLAQLTLLNPTADYLFKPLLYEKLNARKIHLDMQQFFLENDMPVRFIEATAQRIAPHAHPQGQVLLTSKGPINYDYLVLAPGARTNYFGVPGAQEHALPLVSIADMERFETSIEQKLLKADRLLAENPKDFKRISQTLSFQIIGGGMSGVELAFELQRYLKKLIELQYPALQAYSPRIQLLEASDAVLPGFSPYERQYVTRQLQKKGIQVLAGHQVQRIEPGMVYANMVCASPKNPADSSQQQQPLIAVEIPSDEPVWVAGVRANIPDDFLPDDFLLTSHQGRLPVNAFLQLDTPRDDATTTADASIYVVGDAAACMGPNGKPLPMTAQVGEQQAAFLAQQFKYKLTQQAHRRGPFRFFDKGHMLSLGPDHALLSAELPYPLPDLTFHGRVVSWFRHLYYGGRLN